MARNTIVQAAGSSLLAISSFAFGEQLTQGAQIPARPYQAHVDGTLPITAGAVVASGPIVLRNVAEQAGLTSWRHQAGTPEKRFILEAKGAGVALLDYDNDGWLDIYFVNGSTLNAWDGRETATAAWISSSLDISDVDLHPEWGATYGNGPALP